MLDQVSTELTSQNIMGQYNPRAPHQKMLTSPKRPVLDGAKKARGKRNSEEQTSAHRGPFDSRVNHKGGAS